MVVFQNWLTLCPLLSVQVTVQPLIASEPAVTRTSAWKPPLHWLVTEYTAEHDRPPGGGVVGGGVVGGGVVGGGVVGGGVVGGGVVGGGVVGGGVLPPPKVKASISNR
jgi:hypothetical protein